MRYLCLAVLRLKCSTIGGPKLFRFPRIVWTKSDASIRNYRRIDEPTTVMYITVVSSRYVRRIVRAISESESVTPGVDEGPLRFTAFYPTHELNFYVPHSEVVLRQAI